MLRSGNGQHRKPRQAPAFVVTAGVTGAGIALPLLGATGAHAATASTWDKVAQCESGGMWSADSGNGAYGGLQMTQDTWERFGGTAYAERPDLASRQQQIVIAEKVLAAQGADTWGGCAVDAGLAKGGASADVDPGTLNPSTDGSWNDSGASGGSGLSNVPVLGNGSGVTDSSGSSGPSGTSGSSASPVPSGSSDSSGSVDASSPGSVDASGTPSASPSPSSSASSAPSASASSAPSPSGGSGGGRHAKPSPSASGPSASGSASADPTAPGAPSGAPSASPSDPAPTTPGDRGGDRASRGGDDARQQGLGTDGQGSGSYTVQPGDNLSQIATDHSVPGGWPSLYEANKSVVGSNPDLILPGQHLTLG
ncbi:transglycosylase family protein [Streptantibioticus rubrisoli]|uniref:Transglycosylase family protein n=1 Tax=Streptantibioticus rubrisoli TaxID=1387313 RepID=A0ABT1PIQ7_9ACTN|nr:transglycosylase family protein [Streptantibioticus rubrisoli]MCQ4044388.1 transglycosylase family protein [Streptantibioticus rubrisoli]